MLYLTHGEYYKPDCPNGWVSFYCGLPVRAASADAAIRKANAALEPYNGKALSARPVKRMPDMSLADAFSVRLAETLTA